MCCLPCILGTRSAPSGMLRGRSSSRLSKTRKVTRFFFFSPQSPGDACLNFYREIDTAAPFPWSTFTSNLVYMRSNRFPLISGTQSCEKISQIVRLDRYSKSRPDFQKVEVSEVRHLNHVDNANERLVGWLIARLVGGWSSLATASSSSLSSSLARATYQSLIFSPTGGRASTQAGAATTTESDSCTAPASPECSCPPCRSAEQTPGT